MLGIAMLGTSPKIVPALIFSGILIFTFFTFHQPPKFGQSASTDKASQVSNAWSSSTAWAIEDTKSLADQNGFFDVTLEGGARIRQACMLFRSDDGGHAKMGASVVYERAVRTHLKHAEKWGYPSHVLREDIIGQGIWDVLLFGKLLYLQSIIVAEMTKPVGRRAEWIVWFDADTIILNQNIPWSIFLPPREDFSDIHFLGNKDWNGFNCGVFMMRINEWSINFLTQATALPLLRPDVPLGVPFPNYEQDAMNWVLAQEGYKEHAVYQPRMWYNGFAQGPDHQLEIGTGDLLIHFAGTEDKHSAMGHWLDIVEDESEKVNIPLVDLTIHNDIKTFWTELRSAKLALHDATDFLKEDNVAQQVFNNHSELENEMKETTSRLERLVYEEPFLLDTMKETTLLVDGSLRKAAKVKEEAENQEAQRQKQASEDEEREEDEERKKQEEKWQKEQEVQKQQQSAHEHSKSNISSKSTAG